MLIHISFDCVRLDFVKGNHDVTQLQNRLQARFCLIGTMLENGRAATGRQNSWAEGLHHPDFVRILTMKMMVMDINVERLTSQLFVLLTPLPCLHFVSDLL